MKQLKKAKQNGYNLLKKSERIFKTDMIYLAKGGSWLLMGKIFGTLVAFGVAVGFANLLPPDVYGNYKFIMSLTALLGVLTLTGTGTSVLQAVSRGYEGALKKGFSTKLKWSIGIALGALTGAIYYYINGNNTLALSLLIVGSFSPFLESFKLYGAFLNGKKEFKTSTIYGFFKKIIPSALLITTIYFTNNPVIIVLAFFVGHTTTSAFFYFQTLKKYKPNKETDPRTVNYSKHLSLMNILGKIAGNIDSILLFHFLGAAPLAIYSFAKIAPKKIQGLAEPIYTLTFPKIAQSIIPDLKKTLPRKMGIMFLISVAITGIYILSAPYIYKFIFPQYLESVIYSQVFALVILFTPMGFLNQTLTAHMRKKELYILKTVNPIIRISLFLILLPTLGIWGAISASLIIKTLNNLTLFLLFRNTK